MDAQPVTLWRPNSQDQIQLNPWNAVTPYEFSVTVTFMMQCWLAPSTYGDTTNPTLSSASPADDETGVVVGKSIVLTFSEKVDAETGNVTIYRTSDSAVVEAISVSGSQVTGSGTSTITVNPADDLEWNTEYHVLIDATAFDDASSNSYAGISDTTTLSFTTATVPGVPTGLTVDFQPSYAGIQWTPPSNGGTAITGYVVQYSSDAGATWTTAPEGVPGVSEELGRSIEGLVNGTAYLVRVAAVNAAGTGNYSDNLSFTGEGRYL